MTVTVAPPAPLLVAEGVTRRFGGLVAVDALDLQVARGAIHAVIGPNGSGKTTFINLITGAYRLNGGSIQLAGVELSRLRPHRIAAQGLARTFQNIRLFPGLSVLDNVKVGAAQGARVPLPAIVLGLARNQEAEAQIERTSREALSVVGLLQRAGDAALSLPYAQRRLVEIARAIAARPKLLLLDEPAAGMNATEAAALVRTIARLRDDGLTVLLVEHNMKLVMSISERITVLDFGRKIAEGSPDEIRRSPAVVEAYLGRRRAHVEG